MVKIYKSRDNSYITPEYRKKMSKIKQGIPVTNGKYINRIKNGRDVKKQRKEGESYNVGENNPSWKGGKIEYICKNCEKIFLDYPSFKKIGWKKFCSMKCKGEYQSKNNRGINSTNWMGGIEGYIKRNPQKFTEFQKNKLLRKSEKYKIWRKGVFERDHYTCLICGEVGGYLNAHHIKSWKNYPELRFEISNGITKCKDCHYLGHKHKFFKKRS